MVRINICTYANYANYAQIPNIVFFFRCLSIEKSMLILINDIL